VEQTSISGTGASAIYPLLACGIETSWLPVSDNGMLSKCEGDIRFRYWWTVRRICHCLSELCRQSELHVQANMPILQPLHTSLMDVDFVMYFIAARGWFALGRIQGIWSECSETNSINAWKKIDYIDSPTSDVLVHAHRWYSSMLGNMPSIPDPDSLLREHDVRALRNSVVPYLTWWCKVGNCAITEFVQGQTRRWAIGWSSQDARLSDVWLLVDFVVTQVI
jgi:hypothetical protein